MLKVKTMKKTSKVKHSQGVLETWKAHDVFKL